MLSIMTIGLSELWKLGVLSFSEVSFYALKFCAVFKNIWPKEKEPNQPTNGKNPSKLLRLVCFKIL